MNIGKQINKNFFVNIYLTAEIRSSNGCRKGARDWLTSWSHKLNFTDMVIVVFPFIPIPKEGERSHSKETETKH